jgi:hypothetical protein
MREKENIYLCNVKSPITIIKQKFITYFPSKTDKRKGKGLNLSSFSFFIIQVYFFLTCV